MTYSLFACLFNCYVLDYNLTLDDCRRAVRLGVVSIQITETRKISAAGYTLSCGPDEVSR